MSRQRMRLWEALLLAALSLLTAASLICSMSIEPHYVNDPGIAGLSRFSRILVYCARSFGTEQTVGCFLAVGAGDRKSVV